MIQYYDYETIAASQTNVVIGPTGQPGDILSRLVIVPATTSPGAITVRDGTGTSMTVFTGGTVSDIKPFVVELGLIAATEWQITTGANVSVFAIGKFR